MTERPALPAPFGGPRRGGALRRATRDAERDRLAVARTRRRAARSVRSAQRWVALAAASPVVAVVSDHWVWLAAGGASLVKAGFSWHTARSEGARADSAEAGIGSAVPSAPRSSLPVPRVAPPRVPRRSAAAEFARRGEAGLEALYGLVEHLPAGPLTDQGRLAVAAAAETVDDLRVRAGRVAACEAAARAVGDPDRRAQIEAGVPPLLVELRRMVDGIDDLVAATSDAVSAVPGSPLTDVRLVESVGALRALAAGLRELG